MWARRQTEVVDGGDSKHLRRKGETERQLQGEPRRPLSWKRAPGVLGWGNCSAGAVTRGELKQGGGEDRQAGV